MILYGLSNCDTCRKALAALKAAGQDAVLHDLRQTPLPADLRAALLAGFGAAAVNRSSTSFRALPEALKAASPSAQLDADPRVMKRPLILTGAGQLYLGWGLDTQKALGLSA